MMKFPLIRSIPRILHLSIYIGPIAFLSGVIFAFFGEVSARANTVLGGLTIAAAGLIIWGCHGMRRRGKRPGFVLMSALGGTFFFLHLYYRYSDYRWAKISTMSFENTTSATLSHLESRIVLYLSILLITVLIGLLPPLPACTRNRRMIHCDD